MLAASPLSPRAGHVAVWTGERMLIFGGGNLDAQRGPGDRRRHVGYSFDPRTGRTTQLVVETFRDAAAYDSKADRWSRLRPLPKSAQFTTAGAAYDPNTDSWRVLAPAPISGRYRHHAVWTGSEMIVWGGEVGPSQQSDGAAYDPATDTWRRLPPSPLAGRHWASVVWTGREMIVWGGYDNEHAFGDGAAYDPNMNRWRVLPAAPISGRCQNAAVWTGTELIVWGGTEACGSYGRQLADGAALTP
jgi:N-acetylneuraminic acid mutarotase